jgi:chemotaxis protein methyltransferase CheR
MQTRISHELLTRFSDFVAHKTGLNFPPERWADLERGIAAAAKVLRFKDVCECVHLLMSPKSSKTQLNILVQQLTVGETYFFRDAGAFEVLERHVLPMLVRRYANGERRLRIWSAACCTGEEAYSIAITVRRALPDWREWYLHLLATDINPEYLRRAETGRFGNWSFRDAPAWLKEQYFQPVGDGQFEILPDIREMVRFEELNLAEDVYPSLTNDTNAMDVIFCRNVLMYFTPRQAGAVLRKLYQAQVDGGWLFVSPSELLHVATTPYIGTNLSAAMVHRKLQHPVRHEFHSRQTIPTTGNSNPHLDAELQPDQIERLSATHEAFAQEAQTPCVQTPCVQTPCVQTPCVQECLSNIPDEPGMIDEPLQKADAGLLARSLANLGKLVEALHSCDEWILADRLNPSAHYLRAMLLDEQGKPDEAAKSLKAALYLDPKFPLAHFAMSNLARRRNNPREANKHLRNTMEVLRTFPSEQVLPGSDGITAGRLKEIIGGLADKEASV